MLKENYTQKKERKSFKNTLPTQPLLAGVYLSFHFLVLFYLHTRK